MEDVCIDMHVLNAHRFMTYYVMHVTILFGALLAGAVGGMSTLDDLDVEDFVREKIEKERWTHVQVSIFLQENNNKTRGLSERSVRRYCARRGIRKTSRIDEQLLDERVAIATAMVNYHRASYKHSVAFSIPALACQPGSEPPAVSYKLLYLTGWTSLWSKNYDWSTGIAGT